MEMICICVDDVNKVVEILGYDVLVKDNELFINVKDEEILNVICILFEKNI